MDHKICLYCQYSQSYEYDFSFLECRLKNNMLVDLDDACTNFELDFKIRKIKESRGEDE